MLRERIPILYLQWSHGPLAMETAEFQDFPPKWYRSRLQFQGSVHVSLLNCQFSPYSSTFRANNRASATPLTGTAPDLSHCVGDRNCPSRAQSATYPSDYQCLPLPWLGLAAQSPHHVTASSFYGTNIDYDHAVLLEVNDVSQRLLQYDALL